MSKKDPLYMIDQPDRRTANDATRNAWDASAAYWDDYMGEGNDFVNVLIWPATLRLLAPQPGQRILDIACGNGLYARKLAALGAEVTAFDFSTEMIQRAQARGAAATIDYRTLDVTDQAQLLSLGETRFDAAICQMALFDIADIGPLMAALPRLLRPGAPFLFSIMHPCFNSVHVTHMAEREDRGGEMITTHSLKVSGYMTPSVQRGLAVPGQPEPHVYFHRPLGDLLSVAFRHGFVLDALEERAFPAGQPHKGNPLSWGSSFSEFPPVLIARLRHAPSA